MPLLETRGAASARGLGLLSSSVTPVYIEDVFSTWLYTGNGSSQTITNGIDLSGKGGMVWTAVRNNSGWNQCLFDTNRGVNAALVSWNSLAEQSLSLSLVGFNSDGYSLGSNNNVAFSSNTFVNWTFRKAPKFFDVVTYTGNGSSNRQIAHNLGSTPGCIIIKNTINGSTNWIVWHRGIGATDYLVLNGTNASATNSNVFPNSPSSTTFTVSAGAATSVNPNINTETYVAYLFAHNAGGFGLSGTDNVISCGSFNAASAGSVNLGYEPQWVIFKQSDGASDWYMVDNMRGFSNGTSTNQQKLLANSSAPESTVSGISPTATGFDYSAFGGNWIYIAIRRGPMRVPTDGTKVYSPNTTASLGGTVTTSFPVDMSLRSGYIGTNGHFLLDRLRGSSTNSYAQLDTTNTNAESTGTGSGVGLDNNTGFLNNATSADTVWWSFRRAPGFFDEVCYTGDGTTNRLLSHNLAVQPEMIIYKSRSSASYDWIVNYLPYPNSVRLNKTDAAANYANGAAPTATQFYASGTSQNNNTDTYVAYLFATCPGVSKVFSYTGNGSSQTINCGFTGGARFVLIKRTDSTGDWYVWDSARGIVASNDPHLSLNTTAAEVTTDDSVDTDNTGFIVNQVAATNINVSSATYIGLAVA